jgi:UDP-N-acetylmuramoyl-L-alanyl-D-glutamate--2,6-diaminopimelate ligase
LPTGDATCITVPNSRRALARAAQRLFADPSSDLQMVGVTGTNGKTTVVHLVAAILAAAGRKVGILGTLGTRWGGRQRATGLTTPESVDLVALLAQMRDDGVGAVALEVSSHALAQERAAGIGLDVGVFTNITHEHLDYHGTLEDYFAAKRRLLDERLKPGGRAVLNLDDPKIAALAAELDNVVGYTRGPRDSPPARVWAQELTLRPNGIALRVHTPAFDVELDSPLIGRFNADNLLAAVAATASLEVEAAAMATGIAGVTSVPGRMERVGSPDGPLVLVDYAHTPDALNKVLVAAREVSAGRVICVFGCGGDRDADKRPLMGRAVAEHADWAVLTTDNPRGEDPAVIAAQVEPGLDAGTYQVELDRRAAIELAVARARPGDCVLVAGKGHETYQIVGDAERPFDDRICARQALSRAGYTVDPVGSASEG